MWMGYTETDARIPGLGTGGAPTGGPRYHYDADLDSDTKFPRVLRRPVVHRRVEQRLDQDRDARTPTERRSPTSPLTPLARRRSSAPHEMEFGPDGSLYVIDWGSGFNGNNADSGIYRIDYIKGAAQPDRARRGRQGRRPGRR